MFRSPLSSIPKTLADYTEQELLVPELKSPSPENALQQLCSILKRQDRLKDSASFYNAVLARELMSPTSFVSGWALPHARLKELPELCFAVAQAAQPIRWFGQLAVTVQIVFLFVVPEHETRSYLNLVAAVARLSQNSELVATLNSVRDSIGMFQVLKEVPLPGFESRGLSATPAAISQTKP